MTDYVESDDDLHAINDDVHFEHDDEDDDGIFFDPDYVEEIETGPKRPRYPKAAPKLPLNSRLSALKYSRHINTFRKKFAALCVTTFKPDRAHDRLVCARMGTEYFVFKIHCAKYVAPPIPVEFFGRLEHFASPPKLVASAELVYRDDHKLYEKYEAFRRLAFEQPTTPIMILGEKFYCGACDINMSITPYGCRIDIELIYPFDQQHKVHDNLREAENARKKAFAKYTTAEQVVVDRCSLIEATRQLFITVMEKGKLE